MLHFLHAENFFTAKFHSFGAKTGFLQLLMIMHERAVFHGKSKFHQLYSSAYVFWKNQDVWREVVTNFKVV